MTNQSTAEDGRLPAAGVLYRAGDKILLVKRRSGEWAFPAGSIENGESDEMAARREFHEEMGSTIDGPMQRIYQRGGFSLFQHNGPQFTPRLCSEHSEFMWCLPNELPSPLFAGVNEQIGACAMDAATARREDENGYITVERNPITRAGVFQYSGRVLPGADPSKIYNVYRPLEEIAAPEAIESYIGLPIVNDHEMLGEGYQRGAEDRGVHGAILESVEVNGHDILAPIRIFSRSLKSLLDSGKKGLSLGYRCAYEKSAGVFNGMPYDYIQRNIRGNHLALVDEGRCGTAVLDHNWAFDHFDLALDNGGQEMTDKKTDAQDANEPTLAQVMAAVTALTTTVAAVSTKVDAMDAKMCAEDEDEEEKKKDKAEDADEDEDKKKAEDSDDEEKKDKEDGMDAADIKKRLAAVEGRSAPSIKDVRSSIIAAEALAKRVANVVGTFDHSAMDEAEVAAYGCKKLELEAPAGTEKVVLNGYLTAVEKTAKVAFGMDSAIRTKTKEPTKFNETLAARRAKKA